MREPYQRTHDGQLPGMVQCESGNALAIGQESWLAEASQFAAIEKGFQDVLLHLLVAGGDALHFLAQGNEIVYRFVDVVVLVDIVGCGFDAQHVVVPHIMFGKAIAEGSVEECRYYLILSQDLGYGQNDSLMSTLEEASKLLNAYARAILASGS